MPGTQAPQQILTIEQLVALNPYNPDILPDLGSYRWVSRDTLKVDIMYHYRCSLYGRWGRRTALVACNKTADVARSWVSRFVVFDGLSFGYMVSNPSFSSSSPQKLIEEILLPDGPCTLPPNASHQVGIGAFVLNDKNEILAVQEKNGLLKGTGVWKMPTGLTNKSCREDIFDGAIREVKEETGRGSSVVKENLHYFGSVEINRWMPLFLEVVGFRQGIQVAFEKSDLFFLYTLSNLNCDCTTGVRDCGSQGIVGERLIR